ncbi:hypothetical protein MNEG_2918 [Monoraphidium neglectum]|uniref:Uncharacterized protein n=1 Tax=Monoraphidium neglectum TaxID=145388 RepID=A0A0D2NJI7_9CHLO|nr:hypothetical protein MNEG_2918 [Monoraphidium neglectum]KIZ05041.1 hypothetical protein MNEG_2918 [Monoraphidium neglectum]|eukprot:XP_013904060.1 hypothetical protein MNEG_2918 [Monoraphidium neglectum]
MYSAALRQSEALAARGSAAVAAETDGGGGGGSGERGAGSGAVPAALREWEGDLGRRLQACLGKLRGALSCRIEAHLGACGWPPPVSGASSSGGDGSSGGGGLALEGAAQGDITALHQLMVALTRLQLVEERSGFEAAEQSGQPLAALAGPSAPLLWAAQLLAAPLGEKLGALFDNTAPAGRLDRPAWLFQTVVRLAKEYGPQLEVFQSLVDEAGLGGGRYLFGAEFARALREAAKQLLRGRKLPALLEAEDGELWLTWVDAMIDFDTKMAPPLGVIGAGGPASMTSKADGPPLPLPLLRCGALGVLGEREEWMDAWLSSEGGAALRALEGVLYSPGAWDSAPSLQLSFDAEDQPAWRCEFYPPAAAEGAVSLAAGQLLPRAHNFPSDEAQDRYLNFLAADVLGGAHSTVVRTLQQADLFRDAKHHATWMRKACVCVCFCHYLEHHLEDMALTIAEIFERRAEAAQTLDAHSERHQQQQQQQQQQQRQDGASSQTAPGSGGGEKASAAAAATAARRLLSKPLGDFASARREWTLKVAKAVAQGFLQHAQGYMADPAPFKDPDPSAADAAVVSAGLVDGLQWLQGALAALAAQLDRDCFRDCLRAAAAAINRELYNGVATEMLFSPAGARQLAVDVGALLRLFQPYSWRSPRAYFPELLDAVALLTIEHPRATDELQRALGRDGRGPGAAEALREAGVRVLDAEQAAAILSLKL